MTQMSEELSKLVRYFVEVFARISWNVQRQTNIKISRYSEFEKLLKELSTLRSQIEIQRQHLDGHELLTRLVDAQSQLQLLRAAPPPRGVPERKVVVVIITTNSQFPLLKALVKAPKLSGAYDVVVVAYVDPEASGILKFCIENGLTLLRYDFKLLCGASSYGCYEDSEDVLSGISPAPFPSTYVAENQPILEVLNNVLTEAHRQAAIARRAQRFLRHSGTSLMVMFEDNAGYNTGIWAAVARANAVPSVILPFTIADHLEAAEALYLDSQFWADQGIYNRVAKAVFPRWSVLHRDRCLLRRPGLTVLTAEALGYAQPDPWVLNSSKATVIAVESEAMREHYLAQRIPAEKLELTGSPSDDLLYTALQAPRAIWEQLRLDAGKPMLLCSFPPNQLTEKRSECEFDDFKKLIAFWVGELSRMKGWQIVVKPHPSMSAGDVTYLKSFDLLVSDLDTTSLIPLCDIYNTSVSSTIRWALACGKPVLNFDVFRYHYNDFMKESAVIHVYTRRDFSAALARLASDAEFLRREAELAQAAAPRWATLDGHSGRRIADLFQRLITSDRGRVKT